MAISDTTGIIIASYAVVYMLIYQKNKFAGNIIFLILSIAILMSADIDTVYGMILIFVSLASTIYDAARVYYNDK